MGFTPEELAEMARADAEIEESFCISNEDLALSRALDREAVLDGMDSRQRKIAESQRQYRAANKDKIAESKRQYYAANKDKIAESKRQYYAANKDKIAESQRQYYAANKDKIAESKRAIQDARKRLGLTQRQFGTLFGVKQCTVSFWENISTPDNWREIVSVALGHGGEQRC